MSTHDNLGKKDANLDKRDAVDHRSFIELTIEPITGQSFIVDVMGVDTILDLKQIIEITSGILADKQHLVWRSLELQDAETMDSYGIQDGATIQLIPAMRGGPISMRYIEPEIPRQSASDDQLVHDLAELLAETSPDGRHSNKRAIVVIVYSSDQQFHFIRLVDDDSLESSTTGSDTSSSLLLAERGIANDQPKEKSQQTIENEITQERMLQLRKNMDNRSLRKKTLQTGGAQSQSAVLPPGNSLPTLSSVLIPIGSKVTRANVTGSTRSSDMSLTGARPSPGGPASPKSINSRPEKYITKTTAVVMPSPGSQSPHTSLGTPRSPHRPSIGAQSPLHHGAGAQSTARSSHLPPVQPAVVRNTSSSVRVSAAPKETNQTDTDPVSKVNMNPSGAKIRTKQHKEIPLKIDTEKVSSDTAAIRKNDSGTLVPRLSEDSSSWRIQSTSSIRMSLTNALSSTINAVLTGRHSGESTNAALDGNYLLIQSSDRLIPLNGRQLSASALARSFNDIVTTADDQGHTSLQKIGLGNPNRCAICRKKTGITTSFLCRCGGSFCAVHRYPEEHACTVDYKTEGRKTIAHDNPVVQAPKLPKI